MNNKLTVLDILIANLCAWAYDYSGGNSVYVSRGNVAFIQNKLNQNGFNYIKVTSASWLHDGNAALFY